MLIQMLKNSTLTFLLCVSALSKANNVHKVNRSGSLVPSGVFEKRFLG